ncbi:MAG: germination protein YpeB, partial [Ruminiclostridium sp.]|nr:germination protein YpeB [Ruminiclostridium sp.]
VTEGFTDFEEGFSNYPTLIYDGPFSDHILEKEPLMLKGQQEVDQEKALQKAQKASGSDNLTDGGEEGGKMPSYVFTDNNTTVSVTKQGGFLSYMLKFRTVGQPAITAGEARNKAEEYLEKLGIEDITDTYYEINNGVCTCNFAGEQDNDSDDEVTLYTDLIKVSVAMDNGEILGFDARGYITNHTERDLGTPKISKNDAAKKLSDSLRVFEANLCVIPSDGLNERYCYEFYCADDEGKQLLIYLNADTGEEEQILLLQIGSNGRLTV